MEKFSLQLFGESEDAAVDAVRELCKDYKKMSKDDAIKVAELSQLTRIADALEGINGNLSDIAMKLSSVDTNLESCVSEFNGLGFFRIAGEVTTN